ILISLLAVAVNAAPQGYNQNAPSGPPLSAGPLSSGISGGSGFGGSSCGEGQIRHVDGTCVTPQVSRNLYVFNVPPAPPIVGPPPNVPPPTVENNILFIRIPEGGPGQEPIVIPPPQQKNVVYVLNKRPQQDQKVIQIPAPEQENPQVYFINYGEGDNPTLPSGGDLQSALGSAVDGGGEVIGGGSLSAGGGGYVSGGGDFGGDATGGDAAGGEASYVNDGGSADSGDGFPLDIVPSVPQPSESYSQP
ncbi:hypothetical protein OTU49_015147, partial [Cherax quadricarinatus]